MEVRRILVAGVKHEALGSVCRLETGEVVFVVREVRKVVERKVPPPAPPDTIHDVVAEERRRKKTSKRMKEFWRSRSPSTEKVAKNWRARTTPRS